MSLTTRTFLPLCMGLFGLLLSPLGQADNATFSSNPTAASQLYAYDSSHSNRQQTRSYPGDRSSRYVYPGTKAPGYVYPGAEGRGGTQQPHQRYNGNYYKGNAYGSAPHKSRGGTHHNNGHH